MLKPKFTLTELYDNLLYGKGITFNYHSKNEAIDIMANRNYYYRLTSYRKNFEKVEGKYIALDFKALVDLASIDSYLREYLLSLCLDVEHAIKTKIMRLITLNPEEDGYNIIKDYKSNYPKEYDNVLRNMEFSKYKKDLRDKRTEEVSIWVFLEFAGIGEIECLLQLYNSKYRNKKIKVVSKNLIFVRNIRNNCAHNNTFLVNIFDKSTFIKKPSQNSKDIASKLNVNEFFLHYMKCHDVIILFYLHMKLNSLELRSRRKKEGQGFITRTKRNNELHSIYIKSYFKILSNLVDKL